MDAFVIEPAFWELFPDAEIGVMLLTGIDNSLSQSPTARAEIVEHLARQNEAARAHITGPSLSQSPAVAIWREAFTKFKKKKGARASIEALLKRVEKGNAVGPINPLVDIYNAASLQYGLPCGAEDADTVAGAMRLTVTAGGDDFLALGDEENDPTLPGEVCYLDDEGAVCRCWNWREGQRTMTTENTSNAFVIFESATTARHDDLVAAMDTVVDWAARTIGGQVATRAVVTKKAPSVTL